MLPPFREFKKFWTTEEASLPPAALQYCQQDVHERPSSRAERQRKSKTDAVAGRVVARHGCIFCLMVQRAMSSWCLFPFPNA